MLASARSCCIRIMVVLLLVVYAHCVCITCVGCSDVSKFRLVEASFTMCNRVVPKFIEGTL